ncbi:acylneuraminate cytidylyltransferase family protein [Halorubrum sp. PV6]|uniref:acylneuraminate cytidylyltransferase family protein n=1 Tax=Halorubrum sp. PV6 TaxID=634157 RepID=UPI000EB64051|nr:acylneuraminate cytidylyltransferase family protein [Halorubrum sp. PV6]AYD49519.1 CMP-legionaminic acid synthase [Halorubrum sp. PV6]AZQ14281.1 acylneuraminate cytidylyltransferase family protein [Halorubrum sp. PV6]
MSTRTLAVIPARGGSKRVPNKNVREVGGKPLIAHTIEQADNATKIDYAIVSTDNSDIAEVAAEYGGNVPFERPAKLATDTASLAGTITHALDWITKEQDHQFDQVCSLQVTSPLRRSKDIDGALTRLEKSGGYSCISVSEYVTPPQWAVATDENEFLFEFFDYDLLWTDQPTRSQDIPELQHPNGAIFAATTEAWRSHESFYTPKTISYEMPPKRSFDIDEPWELELVRSLMKNGTGCED